MLPLTIGISNLPKKIIKTKKNQGIDKNLLKIGVPSEMTELLIKKG